MDKRKLSKLEPKSSPLWSIGCPRFVQEVVCTGAFYIILVQVITFKKFHVEDN